jgi:hypothetical protein
MSRVVKFVALRCTPTPIVKRIVSGNEFDSTAAIR